MSNVQVLHIEKRVTIAGGLNRHITRVQWVDGKLTVWVPNNANPELTENNVELVSREFTNSAGKKRTLSLQEAVNKRIAEAGIKPRKGQSRCLEMIFSGSSDVMCNMTREELLKWANDTLEWAQKTWGKENVVSASLHVDEKTPHIHMIVVPIVKGQSRRSKKQKELDKERGVARDSYKINHDKLRLCCNEVYTTPLLYGYHDNYAKEVSNKYGLERGLRAEPGNKKKHQTSEDYNRQLAAEAAEKRALITEIQSDYKTATDKKIEAEKKQKEAEDRQALAEQQATEKETKVKELEEKHSSLSLEITEKETRITELDASIEEKENDVSVSLSLKESLDTHNRKLQTKISSQTETIDTNSEKISTQEDDLTYYGQQLETYQGIEKAIADRREDLQSLKSIGLLELMRTIPDMIKKEVQDIVSINWKGELVSYEEFDDKVGDVPQKFVRIHMNNNGHEYEFEVQESNGHVWKDGKWYKWSNTQQDAYMPKLASYFRQELLPEAKDLIASMYKKVEPAPAKTVGQGETVVWEFDSGFQKSRIIQTSDGLYSLQHQEWNTSKVDENGRYYERLWKKTKGFSKYEVLDKDSNYAYLKIKHRDGREEYVNQYGAGLSSKQKKSLGISTGLSL